MKKAIFIGVNALGDTLCTTPVLRAFRKGNPETSIIYVVQNATFCRVLDDNPDIDLLLYSDALLIQGTVPVQHGWLHSLPLDLRETATVFHFDMQHVCSKPESFQEHISMGFSKILNIPIESTRPVVVITPAEQRIARTFVRKPYVVFSIHSVANPRREDGNGFAKEWPHERWLQLAEMIHASGDFDIIAIGSERDTQIQSPSLRTLYGLPIKIVAAILKQACCVVSLENGIAHLCVAVDAPMVEIYSNIVPLAWACPGEASCCEILYDDPQRISVDTVMEAVQSVLSRETQDIKNTP